MQAQERALESASWQRSNVMEEKLAVGLIIACVVVSALAIWIVW